jgi:hypothetical protein
MERAGKIRQPSSSTAIAASSQDVGAFKLPRRFKDPATFADVLIEPVPPTEASDDPAHALE